jgi:hypothetical protein
MRRDSLTHIINVAVNQTLGRTFLTAGTTAIATLSLYMLGGEVLRGIAFTLLVGVITGTYSTVFIAAAIVTFWRGKGPSRAAAHAPEPRPPAGATAVHAGSGHSTGKSPQQPVRKSKPQRKARAS